MGQQMRRSQTSDQQRTRLGSPSATEPVHLHREQINVLPEHAAEPVWPLRTERVLQHSFRERRIGDGCFHRCRCWREPPG